jgi:hypothetical protein
MTDLNTASDTAAPLVGKGLGIDREALWAAADKLRGSIGAAEYKHIVPGLIFLKYISTAFETQREDARWSYGVPSMGKESFNPIAGHQREAA